MLRVLTALAGAAGKRPRILLEAQRRKLEPFHGRQVRKDRVGKLPERHAMTNREDRRLDAVTSLRREDVCAQKPAGVALRH